MASKADPVPPAFGEALARVMAPEQCTGTSSTATTQPARGYKSPGAWSKSQTGYMGVTLHKRTQRYESHIWHDKKQVYLGSYNVAGQAARVHDITALRVKGEAAAEALNFPRSDYDDIMPHLQTLGTTELVLALRNYSKSLNSSGHVNPKPASPAPSTPQQHAAPAPPPAPGNGRGRKRRQTRPSSALDSYDAPGRNDEEEVEVWGGGSQPTPPRRGVQRQRSPAPATLVTPVPPPALAPLPAMPLFRTRQQTAAAAATGAAPPGLPPIPPLTQPAAAVPAAYAPPLMPQFGWGGFPAAPLGALPAAPQQQPAPWPPDYLRNLQFPGFFLQQLQQMQQQTQQNGAGAQQNAPNPPGSGSGTQV